MSVYARSPALTVDPALAFCGGFVVLKALVHYNPAIGATTLAEAKRSVPS